MGSQTTERRLLFLHRHAEAPEGAGTLDLVLTPRFYLLKRDPLPLRFAFQARKLAPSLFEESGPQEPLRYEVLKEPEGWLYFAYNPDEVRTFLKQRGIDTRRLRGLYFAQQFAPSLERPARLPGGREALVTVNGVVTLLPLSLLDEEPVLEAESLSPPRQRFALPLGETASRIGKSTAVALVAASLLLGLAWLAEGIRYQRATGALTQELERSLEQHPTLRSRLTRENIHGKYSRIDRRQRQIRDTVRAIGTLISKESKLDTLALDEKGYRATISAPSKKLKTLKELADGAGLHATVKGGALELSGGWKR